jgi:hypothetical protein
MIQPETNTRIRYHAGLQQALDLDVPSLAELLWKKLPADESVRDVIHTLQILNTELNGEIPSESSQREQNIPRSVVYGVSEIIRLTRNAAERLQDVKRIEALLQFARSIEIGWSAVLAGDIDNIMLHITEEENANQR